MLSYLDYSVVSLPARHLVYSAQWISSTYSSSWLGSVLSVL